MPRKPGTKHAVKGHTKRVQTKNGEHIVEVAPHDRSNPGTSQEPKERRRTCVYCERSVSKVQWETNEYGVHDECWNSIEDHWDEDRIRALVNELEKERTF